MTHDPSDGRDGSDPAVARTSGGPPRPVPAGPSGSAGRPAEGAPDWQGTADRAQDPPPAAEGTDGGPSFVCEDVVAVEDESAADPGLGLGLVRQPGWRPWIRPMIGLGLVLLGIALWILPVLPGFVLAIVGAPMLLSLWPRKRVRLKQRLVRVCERVGIDPARVDRRTRRQRALADDQSGASA